MGFMYHLRRKKKLENVNFHLEGNQLQFLLIDISD